MVPGSGVTVTDPLLTLASKENPHASLKSFRIISRELVPRARVLKVNVAKLKLLA